MIREEINGQTFLDLSDTDLKELKLPMGHREVLLSRIDLLKHSAWPLIPTDWILRR